jgi:DNA-binding transcriptional LysR family regulator
MRWKQLRQADLNLLVAFAVFAEELSISAAAERLFLSQPAASRTLQRLRTLFNDDLLVRGPGGYQLTPAGVRLQTELGRILPELDSLLGRPAFDPAGEEARFRITGSDNVCSILFPLLCQQVLPLAPQVNFTFVPWNRDAFADLDHGRIDLVLSNDEVLVPSHLESQSLYRERWYCIVARSSKLPKRLSLKHYLEAEHVVVSVLDGVQTIPDKRLAALGYTRRSSICVPYFGAALECIPRTSLMLTATSSAARAAEMHPDLRVIEAPAELTGFSFQQVWHPRLNTDPTQRWLRQEMARVVLQIRL